MGRQAIAELQDTLEDGQTLEEGGVTVKVDDKSFHLGYSRLSKFMECPAAFDFTYNQGHRTEGSPVMRRGTALHNTFEDMMKYKAGWEKPMPLDKAITRVHHHCTENRVCKSATEEVLSAMNYFYEHMYSKLTPAMLLDTADPKETPIEGEFKIVRGGVEITGRIDFAAELKKGDTICKGAVAAEDWA